MNWTEFFAAQLEREAPISRRGARAGARGTAGLEAAREVDAPRLPVAARRDHAGAGSR